jgi:predicted nucleic acid-binding protein
VIVIDTSTLVDFILAREAAVTGVLEALGDERHQALHAPELIWPEALNALRSLTLRGHLSEDRASQAALDLDEVRLICFPHAPLRERIWALRHDLTAYDAAYLALALGFDDPVLLTGDRALAARARVELGDDRVTLTR